MTGFVKLVAAARFIHDGRRLFPGDRFEASDGDAADLCAIRFASRAKEDDAAVGATGQSSGPSVVEFAPDADGIEAIIERKPRGRRKKEKRS